MNQINKISNASPHILRRERIFRAVREDCLMTADCSCIQLDRDKFREISRSFLVSSDTAGASLPSSRAEAATISRAKPSSSPVCAGKRGSNRVIDEYILPK